MNVFKVFTIILLITVSLNGKSMKKNKGDSTQSITNYGTNLTIYYVPLDYFSDIPITVENIKYSYFYKIEVSEDVLNNKYLKQLEKIEKLALKKIPKKSIQVGIRMVCEFRYKNKIIYSFALGHEDNALLVNNVVVDKREVFCEFVANFIPKNEYKRFKKLCS